MLYLNRDLKSCVLGVFKTAPGSVIHNDSITLHVDALNLLQWRRQSKINEGKGACGEVWGTPRASFHASSPSGVTRDTRDSPSTELWQHMQNVVYQRSSLATRCPGFLLGFYVGTFCLPCTNISHVFPWTLSSIQISTRSYSYQFWEWRESSEIQVPGHQPMINLLMKQVFF